MGLHLCYELALPAETSRENVLEVLGQLRTSSPESRGHAAINTATGHPD
jgi:hypothetical protein